MPAGYSKRSLADKLGFKAGQRARIVDPPDDYPDTLGPLPPGVRLAARRAAGLDLIQLFVRDRDGLLRRLPALREDLASNGALWVCWPKRASGVDTDLTEDVVRAEALARGLVDVKVCAVDATWSGLKLVVPLRLRPR
jgi:hypothetical protein